MLSTDLIAINSSGPATDSIDTLQLLLDNTEEIVLVFDTNLNNTTYNKAAFAYIKNLFQKDIHHGMNVLDIVPEYLRDGVRSLYTSALAGSTQVFEEEIKKDGDSAILLSRINPAYNQAGEIVGVISVTQDVTEKRKKEKELRAFEQRWRFALEKSNHGLWEWDLQTGVVNYSESYKALHGFSDADLQGDISDWKERIHPDDKASTNKALERHLNSSDPFFETTYRLKDNRNEYRWIHARGMIINRDQDGKSSLMIGSHTDITLQKEADEQYKTLFFRHTIPMCIYDPVSLNIREVNEAALQFYGYARSEFLNLTLNDLGPSEQYENLAYVIKNFDNNKIETNTLQYKKKSGEVFWAEFTGNVIQFQGKEYRLVSAVDITANVLAAQELVKSNERFKLAAEAAAEALWEWDIANDQVYMSPVYKEIFGFDIHVERKYAEWHDYIHPDERKETIEGFYAAIDNPLADKWEKEYQYLTSDGSYIYVLDRCIIKRDENGKAIKAIGAIQNINKRKKVEKELEATNERFKLATKATSDAIYDWDLITNELTWGDGIQSLFGHKANEVTIANWEKLVHVADRTRISQSLNFAVHHSKKNFWKDEYRFKKNDGQYSYVLDRGFLVRDAGGKTIRLIGAMQDITKLKLKERELIKSNDRYKYASLATSEIIWDWNLAKETILWSDNYQKVLGWSLPKDNLLTVKNCLEKFHPDDRERVSNSLHSAIQAPSNTLWHEEFRYLKADGTYAYVSDKGYVIRNGEGEAIKMIGAMEDISEKKYADSMLALERKVFKLNARNNTSLQEVVDNLLKGIEDLYPSMYTSVLLLESNQTIKSFGGPRLPPEFKESINGRQVGPSEGSCGSAMFLKKTIIVTDIATDRLWKKFKDFALSFDFKACWSMPVLDRNGIVMGSIAVYHKEIKEPTPKELHTIERFRDLLRILMENHLSLDKIKAANSRFDSVIQATHDLIWDWDLETGSFYRDKTGMKKVYGVEDEFQISNIHSWMQRIHPDEHNNVQKIINDIIHSHKEKSFDLEYRFRRDDGEYNHVYDRGYLIRNSEGKPIRMVGAAQNISERKKLEKELLQRELDKQKLIAQATIETQEKERSEIGKELHDNVNQVLTTTKLYLDLSVSNPELKDELIQKSSKNIIYVINEIRQLSRSLMNPSLGDLGLVDSLNDLIENIHLTRQLKIKLDTEVEEDHLPENLKITTFRIVQEVLNNALKHAKASVVQIKVKACAKELLLNVIDDGIGFQPHTVLRGAGLKNIQNRVYLANGSISLESSPGKGCNIKIKFPIHNTNNPI